MILLIDHDDSFVFTLARYVAELGCAPEVVRAEQISAEGIVARPPDQIILSPGPGAPEDWPGTLEIVRTLGSSVPVLGVCLGHQCIGAAYGAQVRRASHPCHGMASQIEHDGQGVLADVPSPFLATRYHSLAIVATTLPDELAVTATSSDGAVMGIRHRVHRVEGVQFHPESVLTEWGHRILGNFLDVASARLGKEADQASLCFTPCIPDVREVSRPAPLQQRS